MVDPHALLMKATVASCIADQPQHMHKRLGRQGLADYRGIMIYMGQHPAGDYQFV